MDQKKNAARSEPKTSEVERMEVEELDDLDLARVAGGIMIHPSEENDHCCDYLCE